MTPTVVVGGRIVDAATLSRRVRMFGPQVLVVAGNVVQLLAEMAAQPNTYIGISPNTPQLNLVRPFDSTVSPFTAPGPVEVNNVGRLTVDMIVQYLAESAPDKLPPEATPEGQLAAITARFVDRMLASGVQSYKVLRMPLAVALSRYKPHGFDQLRAGLVAPSKVKPGFDVKQALTSVIVALVLEVRKRAIE